MRAIVIPEFGGPEVLQLADVPDPEPSDGEILVKVKASGVNRADLLQRRGLYPAPPGESEVPGLEFAGVVEEVGGGVTRWRPGDRVMGIVGGGGYAERVAVDERVAVAVPEGMPWSMAGAIPEAYMTAFDAVFRQAALRRGETLLIHAVGSGVGIAAMQLGRRAGAYTIGTSRTASKLVRAGGMGLDAGLDGGGAWERSVMKETHGLGADVIQDLVGAPYLARNQAAIAVGGRHVVVGVPGGSRAEIDLRALMARRARLFGTVLRARAVEEKAGLAEEFSAEVVPGFLDGWLLPVVDRVFPVSRAADAHLRMEANRNFGKIVMVW
ncbi:MAG: NAD(P)H-quinone oxidoreductase [Gemmatimonadota bacterium]|nr:NAD(P)H-quinone oxidoreductase [Gemmatimonadota bacterium]MDE2984013.1 NAD(P)H-quinone oxidoreductase [Gemmatimonadota bacterium]